MPVRILHLEDFADDAELVRETLAAEGIDCQVTWVTNRAAFLEALGRGGFDLVMSDYGLPGFDGATALRMARESLPQTPFIVLSGTLGEEHAIQMLQGGATDYVLKTRLSRLGPAVRRALREAEEQATRRRAEEELEASRLFFDRVADATPNVIYVYDLDQRRIVYVAGATRAVLGRSRDEVLAGGFTAHGAALHPDDRPLLLELLERLRSARDGEVLEGVYRLRHTDGGWRWLRSRDTVFRRGPGGQARQIVGIAEDVTERKREEQRRATQFAVTRVLAEATRLEEARPQVLEALGHGLDFAVCEWWEVVEGGGARRLDVWCDDVAATSAFVMAGSTPTLSGDSLEARVWVGGRSRWIQDAGSEPDLQRRALAEAAGLHAAFAVPVRSGGDVRAVLLGFSHEARERDEDLMWMLDALGSQVGAFVERQQAEQALRESQERFELVARATNDAVWDWDLRTGRAWWSDAIRTLFGYAPEDIHGPLEWWLEHIHPEDRERVREELESLLAGSGQAIAIEYRFRRADGSEAVVLDRGFLLRDAQGQPVRMLGSMIDLTERRRAERRIVEQAALLDKASDAILVRTLDGRIEYWNKGAERLYGWRAEEAVGRDAATVLRNESARVREALAKVVETGEWIGELEKEKRGGGRVVVESRWSLVRDEAGRPRAILTIDTDVTERKLLEAQFLRAQRMESIGTLAGGIAHDLNNVLSPILMAVEILGRSVSDDRGRRMLATIDSSARRGADMVKQVLTFARGIEGERIVLQPRHVLKEMEKIVRETFPKTLQFRVEAAADLWNVCGDATQIHQVLLNLCVNARDAMPHGGVLALKADNVVVDDHYAALHLDARPGPYVVLSVTDTGAGIPEGLRERIFEPFFTTKDTGKGTGLGLSTSLAIVRSHGGFVNLYTEIGRGTTFKVYLPAATTQTVAPSAPQAGAPLGRGELVLVIDDEAAIREITQDTLEAHGYRVLTASEGAEAVALFARSAGGVAVVLTDMTMPLMDGQATIRALRRIDPNVPIIATSGLAANGLAAPEDGTTQAFLLKPYTAERLLTTLRAVLEAKEGASGAASD